MKSRLGSLLVGVGAASLTLLGMPAMTATAGATPGATSPFRATFPVTKTASTVSFVGTTTFTATQPAIDTGLTTSAAHPLPANLSSVQTPVVPDVGKGVSVGGRPTPHGKGIGHFSTPHATTSQTVMPTAGGARSQLGIDAYDQGLLSPTYTHAGLPGLDVEPSDQGLCSNGTFTVELNNSVMQVFAGPAMRPESVHGMALENLFDTPETAGVTRATGTVNVQGDPRCQWDPTSGRWFATELWLTTSGATSPRNATLGWAGVLVAVSTSTDPTGTWNVFFVPDLNNLTASTGCNNGPYTTLPFVNTGTANPCFGDQPLLGVNGNSVFLSTNEYSIFSTAPYQVANVYFLDKADLTTYSGKTGTLSPIWWARPGTTVPRDTATTIRKTTTRRAWWSITPAVSDGAYPSTTFYAMSNVTFRTYTGTAGGTKVALWAFDTAQVGTATGLTASMVVSTTTGVSYDNPPFAIQKAGTTPLGTLWNHFAPKGGHGQRTFGKEGPIQTNTDRITTAAYDPATGAVWGAMNTGVTGTSRAGIAWFALDPAGSGSSLGATNVHAGTVAPSTADVMYPSLAFTRTGSGIMDMSLSGADYYPSTAYALVTGTTTAPNPDRPVISAIHISFAGVGPEDGFSEYTATYDTPRWGDYSTAVASGTTFYFASEAIGQRCSVSQFKRTFTCGGTRDLFINWGTSVNRLTASS